MNDNEGEKNTIQVSDVALQQLPKARGSWIWMGISAVLLLALILVLVRDSGQNGMTEVVGEAEGISITDADLYDEMLKQMGKMGYSPGQLVDTLITNHLIQQEADKADVTVTDEDLNQEIDTIMTQFGSSEQFEQAMAQYGYTTESLKEEIKLNLLMEGILKPGIAADDETIQAYFDDHIDTFATTPEQVRASHILLSSQEEAEAVLKELNAGADFAELAKEKSQDPGSKDLGGDLNYFERGIMHAEFEDAAFALAVGETSEVVSSPSGFHIIRVADKKAAVVPDYAEIKEQVKDRYMAEQMQTKSTEWLEQIKKEANVKNTLLEEAEA